MRFSPHSLLTLGLTLPLLTSCIALTGSPRTVDTQTGESVSIDQLADALTDYDVIFLGEEHDNTAVHELQFELTRALHERRDEVALSLEMFERDVQNELNFYLLGVIDEESMLERTRPWSNYERHYRVGIEYARANDLDVIAANCPRSLAAKVASEGIAAVLGSGYVASNVTTWDSAYRARFDAVMSGHGGMDSSMDKFYAAQCVKDDTMAESIAHYIRDHASDQPQVVHWCGRFHSDYHLGTVSRLAQRNPDLKIAVISCISGLRTYRDLTEDERRLGQYVWLVPPAN
ncbi:MAG: putative iron-regulated protein [Planctomycetota bacterium]|jgi:uncharacterized iron-regulated protein